MLIISSRKYSRVIKRTELKRKYATLPGKIRGAYSGKMYTVWATKTKKIPQGYNRYSKDYTGKSPKYQYSIQDLIVRHQYIANNHTILSPNIIKAEKAGKAFPLSSPEVKEQYKALFGTNSAIFAWAKYAAGSAGAVKDEFCFYLRGFADAVTSLIDSIEIKPHYWNPLCVKTKVGDCKACQYAYAPAFKNMFGMIEDQRLRTKLQEDFAFFAGVYNGMLGQLKGFTQMISLISGYFSDPKIRNQMAQAMNKLRKKGVWKLVKEEYSKATCNNFVTNYTQGKVLVDLLSIYVGAPKTINGFIEFTGKQLDNLTTKIAPTLTKLNLVTKKLSNKAIKLVKESGVFKIKKADKTLAQLNPEGKLEVTRALRTQPAGDLAALRARGEATQPIAARLPDGTEMNIVIYKQRTNAGEELVHCQPNGKRTCFVAGTLILTNKDHKKIEDIRVGDWVWSYNEKTGKQELKRVTKVFVRQTQKLINLYFGNEIIQTTLEHPFRHQGKWVKANALKAGDRLQLYQSSAQLALDSLARQDTSVTVYNFTVASNHNYFVGKQGVLVHNANGYDDLLARTNSQPLKDKINALGNDKAKFLDDFKDVDAVLAKFEAKPELVEAWKVLYKADPKDAARLGKNGELDDVHKYLIYSNKSPSNIAIEIQAMGAYNKWLSNVKQFIKPFIHIDAKNYKSFLQETAKAVTNSKCRDNCSVVSISIALKLQGKPILDKSKFLESFVGKGGEHGLNRLEDYLKKIPSDKSDMTRPFLNGFPHRAQIASSYKPLPLNNRVFVTKLLEDSPNGSSFVFSTYKGTQYSGHGQGYKGHTFNVIKDKDGVIKYLDGQIESNLQLGVGMAELLEKMRIHGRENLSSWYIFDASQITVK
ncbi:intein C-terminal splicing region domain protein [Microscilla marina]|uniref:Intein C-terminal splicing region domain protein n=1 Tax=Microscilla marina ATCC 23134 TaxID=313606 RepID=A2A0H7_MICM2|nr:intein C-terminal splicing region domain protein [Microscilla marina]EAY23862.1 intein C-terminal splicing region domain protein [Microscilla marina ATCC 23134]